MRIVLERRYTKEGKDGFDVARLEEGPHGGYAVEWKPITDPTEFLALARSFGWKEEGDSSQATKFLESNIGAVIEDPGYFPTEKPKKR